MKKFSIVVICFVIGLSARPALAELNNAESSCLIFRALALNIKAAREVQNDRLAILRIEQKIGLPPSFSEEGIKKSIPGMDKALIDAEERINRLEKEAEQSRK